MRNFTAFAWKVGLGFAIASLLNLIPLHFGKDILWGAIVVTTFLEFVAGDTIDKGFSRSAGVLVATVLGYALSYAVLLFGVRYQFIVCCIGFPTSIHLICHLVNHCGFSAVAVMTTFLVVFDSNYHSQPTQVTVGMQAYAFGVGSVISLILCLVVGHRSRKELDRCIASRLEALSNLVQFSVNGYFNDEVSEHSANNILEDPTFSFCRTILSSKLEDEKQALHASWRRCRIPSKQYVELGVALRNFGSAVNHLGASLNRKLQVPIRLREPLAAPCIIVADTVSRQLKALVDCTKERRVPSHDGDLDSAMAVVNSALAQLHQQEWEHDEHAGLPEMGVKIFIQSLSDMVESLSSLNEEVEQFVRGANPKEESRDV